MSEHALTFRADDQMGEYRAQVVSTQDPKRLLRVQVRVHGWWAGVPDQDLPWAEYKLASARPNAGDFEPAEVGDWVWVDFPGGDTRYPRITGWCHFAPGGAPNLPHEAWQGPQAYAHQRLDVQPTPAAPPYHGARVSTKHGTTIERAPDGSCRVTQRASGTALEITADGHIVLHGAADVFHSSDGDTRQNVGANLIVKVAGNARMEVGGDMTAEVAGTAKVNAKSIHHNDGSPVVTTAHICHFTGNPHGDGSSTVTAGK